MRNVAITTTIGAIVTSTLLASTAVAKGTSPTWAEMSGTADPEAVRVVQYLDLADDSRLVILGAGAEQGIVAGSTFKAFRPSGKAGGEIMVETGRLKAVEVQPTYTVANVEEQGSRLSKAFFPKFAGVMAGDVAVMQRVTLTRRQAVMPTVTLSYFDVFEDPKADPGSFELRADGVAKLRDAAKAFADARLSLLMVEGYTDHHGPSNANQVESYQRALTVRQYLIDELGFDPSRVVAVGYGEAEPADSSLAPGYVEANRRIVLKAVPTP